MDLASLGTTPLEKWKRAMHNPSPSHIEAHADDLGASEIAASEAKQASRLKPRTRGLHGRKGEGYGSIICTKTCPVTGRELQLHATKGWRSFRAVR